MGKKEKACLFILTSLCFLVYFNSLNNAFIIDDIPAIIKNPAIFYPQRFLLDPASLINSLCFLISQDNPIVYHLANIILHSINTILVFFFLRLFFNTESGFLAAGLFAVHPIHAEAVTWISGKPYLILTLFILATYLLYYRATNTLETNKKPKIAGYLLSLLLFSYFIIKNIAFYLVFMPLILILSDIVFKRWQKNWKLWLPFLIILLVRLILAKSEILSRASFMTSIIGRERPVWINPVVNFAFVILSHLGLLLWPVNLTLYHEPIHPYNIGVIAAILFLGFIIAALFFLFKKAKELFFGLMIFILFFIPVYSPLRVASFLVAERYLYLPSITLSIFAAYLYQRYSSRSYQARNAILLCFTILLLFYAGRTTIRNRDWKTPERFWEATLLASPKSPAAHNGMGLVYYENGQIQKATDSFNQAIRLNPGYDAAYNNLGNIYSDLGRKEKAISFFKKAIEANPAYIEAYNNLGNVYSDMDRREEAVSSYKKAIEINPLDPDVYYNLGNLYNEMGRIGEAAGAFQKAIKINPRDINALNNLGIIYTQLSRRKEAIELFKKAIKVNPHYALAYFNLSLAYFYEREYNLAIQYSDKAAGLGQRIPAGFLEQLRPYRE